MLRFAVLGLLLSAATILSAGALTKTPSGDKAVRFIATSTTAKNTGKVVSAPALPPPSTTQTISQTIVDNWFYIAEVVVLAFAKTWPSIGKTGGVLKPELWINKVGVMTIFFLNGLSLSMNQLQSAGVEWRIHSLVQAYNLGFLPFMGYFTFKNIFGDPRFKLFTHLHRYPGIKDGLMCLGALPCTINICVTLTQAAGADVICSIFNAVVGNIIGVFWTPVLATLMLQASHSTSSLHDALLKLAKLVLVPIFIGQLSRYTSIGKTILNHKKYTKLLSEFVLLGVVLNTFSDTFLRGFDLSSQAILTLTALLSVMYLVSNAFFWNFSKITNPEIEVRTRAAAMICSSQKTLAFGVPFIKTTFGHRADIAMILTPLLIYYPIQVFLGSMVVVNVSKKKIEKYDAISLKQTSA